jgi:hypothetical protein
LSAPPQREDNMARFDITTGERLDPEPEPKQQQTPTPEPAQDKKAEPGLVPNAQPNRPKGK